MTKEKFELETNTLKKFFETYCNDKHREQKNHTSYINYKSDNFILELNLCEECNKSINYSFTKLQGCPHEIKPRCRVCPKPCYGKQEWKDTAKIMKYSAIKLSLGKIKSRILKIFE